MSKNDQGIVMTKKIFNIAWVILVLLIGCAEQQSKPKNQASSNILAGLGDNHFKITTTSDRAQTFFDRGLILAYAFNHQESAAAFQSAIDSDPHCAMCYWGLAYVLGPNINAPMEPSSVSKAHIAVQHAKARAIGVTPIERATIDALMYRYSAQVLDDRSALDSAYANAMRKVFQTFADQADIGTLFADALMNQHPWDYWTAGGQPKSWAPEIVSVLEQVLSVAPLHPGANHLYIHAVEASDHPERGLASADRLGKLVPASGHLVHMPAHIYIRIGDYQKAIEANQRAVAVDRDYMKHGHRSGIYRLAYVPHNYHFLWAAASKAGCSAEAMAAAYSTAEHVDVKSMRQPGMATLEHYYAIPHYAQIRFGRWDEILETPQPEADLRYATAVWHLARGMAYVAKSDLPKANTELKAMKRIAAEPEVAQMSIWEMNSMVQILDIANHLLKGEIAAAQGEIEVALKHLHIAVALEDALHYNEPSDWVFPVRQSLGAILMRANRYVEAETVYRTDLAKNPETGWSLFGLAASLDAQQKTDEANNVRDRFEKAWSKADIQLKESRILN